METTVKPGQIFELMPKVMKSIGAIGKGRDAQAGNTRYKFRGIDDIYNAVNGPLAEHSVTVVPEVLEMTRSERDKIYQGQVSGVLFYVTVRLAVTLYAPDGSFVRSVSAGEAFDSGDKATAKAMSIAYRYAFLQIFCIPTEEQKDTEAEEHQVAPRREPSAPRPPIQPATDENFSGPATPEELEQVEALHGEVGGDELIGRVLKKAGVDNVSQLKRTQVRYIIGKLTEAKAKAKAA